MPPRPLGAILCAMTAPPAQTGEPSPNRAADAPFDHDGSTVRAPSRLLVWFGAVLIAASLAALAVILWQLREDAIDKAKTDLHRLALSQSEQTAAALKGADLALLDVSNAIRHGPTDNEILHQMLEAMVATLPQLKALFVLDTEGRSIHSARSNPSPQISLADQPYFQAHKTGHVGLLLTPTFRARIDGRWSMLLSRRIDDASGRFAGVAVAAIDPLYLSSLYAAIDLGPRAAIALLNSDDVMLARFPWVESRIGQPVESARLRPLVTQSRTGTARAVSSVDHVDRLYGYAALDEYPVVVRTVLDTSVVLDVWRRHAYLAAGGVVIADAVIAVLIGLLVVQLRRRERSEARFRDFAEAASDWYWETDENLHFTYVSRAGRGQLEFPVHDAVGRNLRDLVVAGPGDPTLTELEATVADMRMFREFLCQVRTPSGRISHLNLSGMPRFDDRGEFLGYRGVARDITAVVEERSVSAKANMRFLYAMEHGTNGFSFWDAEDRFVVCNEVYRQRAGRAAKFLVPGITFERFYWESIRLGEVPSPPGRAAEVLAARMATHRAASGEVAVGERLGGRVLSRDLRTPDGGILIVLTDLGDSDGTRSIEFRTA